MLAASFALASLLLAQAPAPGGWILSCDTAPARPGAAVQTRVFRLGPGRLQEWKADQKAFGPNLCQLFRCRADRGRLEGAIESSSVIFTITYDPQSKQASWRTTGVSGGARTSGACAARPDAAGPSAG
jgi:hypothetical protein